MLLGKSNEILDTDYFERYHGKVNLIFTSPPFPLSTKKRYGNETGEEYVEWLCAFGPKLRRLLAPDGSIVMEMGNAWEAGVPVMSTLALKALLKFQETNDLFLCQEFIWHNTARIPSPAQWVNVERIRVKDSFTRLWWLSTTQKPKANNRNVLKEYSASMKTLLKTKKYNSGLRPSEHRVGKKSFLVNHGGAIPGSVLNLSNTTNNGDYISYCKENKIPMHPARMPIDLASFFIKFLTEPGDIVLDPFSGSNTTGSAAERLGRYWFSIESSKEYVRGSRGRFLSSMVE
jgi:site-specific DNA-methyltransferase (cytosine-N4-specific)